VRRRIAIESDADRSAPLGAKRFAEEGLGCCQSLFINLPDKDYLDNECNGKCTITVSNG
jgi:hypothetical protein